jgi:hypothetical protein
VGGRNRRTVWEIATQPYPEAHFATFPEALVEPCILAGTSAKGACAECGAPWERHVERTGRIVGKDRGGNYINRDIPDEVYGKLTLAGGVPYRPGMHYETVEKGWRPTCAHTDAAIVPCIVLDPFSGSGTVALVAQRLKRASIGIDLNPTYVDLAKRRCGILPRDPKVRQLEAVG